MHIEFDKIFKEHKDNLKLFINKFKNELDNTDKAKDILVRYIKQENVTEKELQFFRKQCIRILKGIGVGIPVVILPFGIPLLAFIVYLSKKHKIKIF